MYEKKEERKKQQLDIGNASIMVYFVYIFQRT